MTDKTIKSRSENENNLILEQIIKNLAATEKLRGDAKASKWGEQTERMIKPTTDYVLFGTQAHVVSLPPKPLWWHMIRALKAVIRNAMRLI